MRMKFVQVAVFLLIPLLFALTGCDSGDSGQEGDTKKPFLQIGEFSVSYVSDTLTEVRDGGGRQLALIPRDAEAPKGYDPTMVVRVPVKRVVAYADFDVATLRVLGELDTLVGLTSPKNKWYVDDVRQGFDSGKIVYLGDYTAINFELLKQQEPELVLTWNPAIIPMLNELGIPCLITSTPVAMCLNARMSYVRFLGTFFSKEKEAEAYFERVKASLQDIRDRTAGEWEKPRVMWGDMYEKRVLVEPGNAWVGELVGLVQSDYLFKDVYGTSCIEISMERFLTSGQEADIYFTYRTPDTGSTSKDAIKKLHPLLADIRPLGPKGKVYAPLPHYFQSGDKLDEIFTEIAAIIHPKAYPGYQLRYFLKLPETDLEN